MNISEQYDRLLRYCYMKVRNRETAEDITQESFARYLESENYRESGKEMAYLYTIARNMCTDYFRKTKAIPIEDLPQDVRERMEYEECREDEAEERLVIEAAMDKLDDQSREIVTMRYIAGLSDAEIGRVLGLSRFSVHRRLKETLEKLKEELEGAENDR